MDIAYELAGLAAFIAILLIALAYGGWRTGWFSRQEKARTDRAALESQGGQQGGWWQGSSHTRPDDSTRGV
jgi:hypothetical protein